MVVDPQSMITLYVLFFFRGVKLCAEKYPHKIGGAGGVRHPHFRRIKNILLVTFLLQLIALFSRPPHISRFFIFLSTLHIYYIIIFLKFQGDEGSDCEKASHSFILTFTLKLLSHSFHLRLSSLH